MKKTLLAICTALLVVCTAAGFASCSAGGGSEQSGTEQTKKAPAIGNKPADNTLMLTNDSMTYQFNVEYDGTVTWISTVKSVATISDNGLLTLVGAGYTEVIARDEATGLSDSFILTVVDEREAETLTITGLPQEIRMGDAAIQLGATSSTGNAVSVIFSSNNPSVVTVSETGLLTVVGKGVATITAAKVDSNVKTSVQI